MKQKIIFLYIFRPYNSKKSVGLEFQLGFELRFRLRFGLGLEKFLKKLFFSCGFMTSSGGNLTFSCANLVYPYNYNSFNLIN